MLSRGFCDWERSKVLLKSDSENRKPIRRVYKYLNLRNDPFFYFLPIPDEDAILTETDTE